MKVILLIEQHWKKAIYVALLVLVAYWILQSCLPDLSTNQLPSSVISNIEKRYNKCIDYFPIFPGERRQPECGDVDISVVGLGSIPGDQKASGVTKAVCYRVTYTNPAVTTQGQTVGHEIFWHSRSASKVTVLQNGSWQLFPDQDQLDVQRWMTFSCAGPYEFKEEK